VLSRRRVARMAGSLAGVCLQAVSDSRLPTVWIAAPILLLALHKDRAGEPNGLCPRAQSFTQGSTGHSGESDGIGVPRQRTDTSEPVVLKIVAYWGEGDHE
jgi:hypothetical protein